MASNNSHSGGGRAGTSLCDVRPAAPANPGGEPRPPGSTPWGPSDGPAAAASGTSQSLIAEPGGYTGVSLRCSSRGLAYASFHGRKQTGTQGLKRPGGRASAGTPSARTASARTPHRSMGRAQRGANFRRSPLRGAGLPVRAPLPIRARLPVREGPGDGVGDPSLHVARALGARTSERFASGHPRRSRWIGGWNRLCAVPAPAQGERPPVALRLCAPASWTTGGC